MTIGFNYETMEWKSYEDFLYSFRDETTRENRKKAFIHLKGPSIRTTPTPQEVLFISTMIELHSKHHGEEIDSICNRYGCFGIIQSKAEEGMSCTCFQNAPCSKCMSGNYCHECGWDSDEDN